eukprot:TRINITY_DN72707_c0_g1_i1.p1 TRINITY_DN72707_c0_g1~~TRINITY_DN72707_c0_g1_i1.p1  ORF type:complete len:486 (-),score=31.18 TRINITY_DN72707_c0_g1_i1:65-1495(-)
MVSKPTIAIPSGPAPVSLGITVEQLKYLHKIRQDAEKSLKSVQQKKLTIFTLREFLGRIYDYITKALLNEPTVPASQTMMNIIAEETERLKQDEKEVLKAVPALLHYDITPNTILSEQTKLIVLANLYDFAQACLNDPSSGEIDYASTVIGVFGDSVKDFADLSNGTVYNIFTYINLIDLLYFRENAVTMRLAIKSLKTVMNASYYMDISKDPETASVYKTFCEIFHSPLVKGKYIEINKMLDPRISVKDIEKHMDQVQEMLRGLWIVDNSVFNKLSGDDNTWLAVTLRGEHVCIRKSVIEDIKHALDSKSKIIAEATLLIILLHEGSPIERFFSGCAFAFFGTQKNYKSSFDLSNNVKGEIGEWLEDFLCITRLLTEDQSKQLLNPKNYYNEESIRKLHDAFEGHQEEYRKLGASSTNPRFEPKKDTTICGNRFFSISPRSFDLSERLAKMLDDKGKHQPNSYFNDAFVAFNQCI